MGVTASNFTPTNLSSIARRANENRASQRFSLEFVRRMELMDHTNPSESVSTPSLTVQSKPPVVSEVPVDPAR